MTRRLLIALTVLAATAAPATADPTALLEDGFAAYRDGDWAAAAERCKDAEAGGLQGRFLADALFCQADAALRRSMPCMAVAVRAAAVADEAAATDTTASAQGLRTMRYRSNLVAARCALLAQKPEKAVPFAATAVSIDRTKDALMAHCGALTATASPAAVGPCEAAVDAMPANANAIATLGVAYAVAGRRDEARTSLERALALDPSNAIAAQALPGLK